MFWGLIMEPNKRYTQTVAKSFHVSMASLDVPSAGTGAVEVMLSYENRNYLLCTLQPGLAIQVPLDLNFVEGTEIAFASSGTGRVHLTGYLVPEDDLDLDELEEEEEDDDEVEVPQLVEKQSKRKSSDLNAQGQRNSKRAKHDTEEDESSDDDEDLAEDDSDSDDKDEFEDEDLIEAEGDSEEDEEEDEVEEVVKPLSKKQKRKLRQQEQQEAQQQQQTKKQEKEKLVNGKDTKPDQKQQKKQKGEQQQSPENKQEPKKRTVAGGVKIEELQVGTGAVAKAGKHLAVYYIGRLQNGKKFDSVNRGDGFKFRIGKNEVIQGWDVGIAGMKVGGKRRITVPPALAYGARGSPPVIPPNSTLVFEVELKNVR